MSQDEFDELENAADTTSNTEAGDLDASNDSSAAPSPEDAPDYEPDEIPEKKEVAVGNEERAKAKVQLDIEDAPFLEDDDEEEEEEAAGTEGKKDGDGEGGEGGEDSEENKKKSKKKKLIIIGAAALLLIIIAVVAFLFLGGEPAEEVVPDVYVPLVDEDGNIIPNPELEPFVIVVEPFVEPTGPPVYSLDLEPFWVESRDADNKTFFIVCNFTLIAEEEKNLVNLNAQLAAIRDAIYYHLATQDYTLLTNTNNLPILRQSLMSRVNELLPGIKIKDLLYTNYTVR